MQQYKQFSGQSLLPNSPMQPVLGEDLPKLLTGNELLMLYFAGLNDKDTTQCICRCLKNYVRTLTITYLVKPA